MNNEIEKLHKQAEFWHKVWLVSTIIFILSRLASLFL